MPTTPEEAANSDCPPNQISAKGQLHTRTALRCCPVLYLHIFGVSSSDCGGPQSQMIPRYTGTEPRKRLD
ncbi:hypothetical protein GN956_G13802 [Arapaima gigas]